MERKAFIKQCCCALVAIPAASIFLSSCASIYYASTKREGNVLTVSKSEFVQAKKDKKTFREFVYLEVAGLGFPICLYRQSEDKYIAALLKCTHRGCELNAGGGIYSCPCHGSEFSIDGQVLEGPAEENLQLYKTESDSENVYVYLL